jgi:hypothetical protein
VEGGISVSLSTARVTALENAKGFSNATVDIKHNQMIVSFSALLSADQMTPARNATDVHAHYFVANDELLLPMLKTPAQNIRRLHATRNDRCFQSACSSRTVRLSVACTNCE